MMTTRFLHLLALVVLYLLGNQITQAQRWEVKRLTGDPYSPPIFSISLEDHNTAFISSAYCVDGEGMPTSYLRDLCEECPDCVWWKRRTGFATEAEWQTAVMAEMERLHGQGVGSTTDNGSLEQEEEGGGEEIVGSWIAEVPFTVRLNDVIIEELASSLGVLLQNTPIISEMGDRGYFFVSGTPRSVKGLLSAGFSSLTPILPRLKVDPVLEEAAAAAAAAPASAAPPVLLSSSNSEGPTDDHSLHVQLAPRPLPLSHVLLSKRNSNNNHNITTTTPSRAQFLSSAWAGEISTHLGHARAKVLVTGDNRVTIEGLESRSELYRVALVVASHHGDVKWVGRQVHMVPSNLFASQLVQSGRWWIPEVLSEEIPAHYNPLSAIGLTGKGEVVGIADTGIDFESCYFKDDNVAPKFKGWDDKTRRDKRRFGRDEFDIWSTKKHRKIRQYVAFMNDKEDKKDGHGTHIAGSIAGSTAQTDVVFSEYQGVAPEAKIAFFDLYSKDSGNGGRVGLPVDIGEHMFKRAYGVGARIYVFSFNEEAPLQPEEVHSISMYSDLAREIDAYCYEHQDFIVFISAGNQQNERRGGRATITSPAEAKNAVTVGSHYNPTREAGPPPVDLKGGLAIAPNSARGPTFDGRIKPDVCGPGHSVVSAASFPSDASQPTVAKDGTSSANAIVAGATVLVRQYFTKGLYPDGTKKRFKSGFKPLGALLKAILVNSGSQLSAGWSSDTEDAISGPTNVQGFGGVNLKSTLVTPTSPPGLQLKVYGKYVGKSPFVMDRGESRLYDLQITEETHDLPLKITLVWFDRPTDTFASKALVSDLDLSVARLQKESEQPDPNAIYYANGKTYYDKANTVEHIVVPNPKAGERYLIRVKGSVIPYQQYQTFALVISGPFHRDQVIRTKMDSPPVDIGYSPSPHVNDMTPPRDPIPEWPVPPMSPPRRVRRKKRRQSRRNGWST